MRIFKSTRSAFTLVKLIVVVAVIAALGTLLVPGLALENKSQARLAICVGNHERLIQAWQLYAGDCDEYVVNNYAIPGTETAISKWKTSGVMETWAPNVMTFTVGTGTDSTSVTNTALAQSSPLVRYGATSESFHCPADNFLSRAQKAAGYQYRLRSVSMNSNWGRSDPGEPKQGNLSSWGYGSPFRQWSRTSEVVKPIARYVFLDEQADSMNDGFFIVNWGTGTGEYPSTSSGASWGDIPGFYHENGTPFAFADGHTEFKKWKSKAIVPKADGTFTSGPANLLDQQWYVQHVAERR